MRARGAGPKQPEKMVGRTTTTLANPATVITEKPAELSFCGLCLPWQLIYSRSLLQQAQASAELRSCVDGSRALPIYGPFEWLVALDCSFGKTKSCPAGRTKSMLRMVDIQPVAGRNLRAVRADGKARRTFVLRALFTLAAIYSRGTCRPTTIDVLMFHFRVRNGTGWGHQAMTTRFQGALRCSARCLPW